MIKKMTEERIPDPHSGKITLRKLVAHFSTIQHHRHLVRKFCFRMGLYYQGMMHDLSKFAPIEFWNGVRYYQGTRSPNIKEREVHGYSAAWLHHKGRNKHHFEYWVDFSMKSKLPGCLMPIRMPDRYIAEMVADRVAASRTYRGSQYQQTDAFEYYRLGQGRLPLHPYTQEKLEFFLQMIAEKGENATFDYIRTVFLKEARINGTS